METVQMKPGRLVLVAVVAMLLVSGCSKPANENINNVATATPATKASATPDEFAFARATYAKECFECHGRDGKGGLVKVEDVKLKVPSFMSDHALKHSDEDFVDQIENGGDGMPKFKDKLSAQEIDAMVRFIRHEFQGKQ
jgi:mono/diheme cytochrome c family protein